MKTEIINTKFLEGVSYYIGFDRDMHYSSSADKDEFARKWLTEHGITPKLMTNIRAEYYAGRCEGYWIDNYNYKDAAYQ